MEEPVNGFLLHGIADGGQDGSFTLTERYFLEAAEGHGARFYSMAEEFMAVAPE